MTLVYTDSPGERIGLIDITDPKAPKPAGVVALDGEPTSVVVIGGKALVGVVTSESKDKPSGHLAVVDLATKAVVATCDLGGQPDSLAKSPDGKFLAIAIENERDEEVNDGAIPQLPGGNLTIFAARPTEPSTAPRKKVVDLTGLAAVAPEDPEPEYRRHQRPQRGRRHAPGEQPHRRRRPRHRQGRSRTSPPAPSISTSIDTEKDGVIELTGSKSGVAARAGRACSGSTTIASSPPMRATGRAAAAASPSSTRTARSTSTAAPRSNT